MRISCHPDPELYIGVSSINLRHFGKLSAPNFDNNPKLATIKTIHIRVYIYMDIVQVFFLDL